MKAMVYQGEGRAALLQKPRPVIQKPTDAVIRVTLSTICSSDIHILHGAVPKAVPGVTLGHEFVGIVEETGPAVRSVSVGDRVAVNVETFCGECFFCKRGYVNNCTDPEGGWSLGCRIDGGQAEYARIPFADQGLIRIPDEVSDEEALFTGDLLSTGYWAAQMVEIRKGDTVVVIGAGPAGLCTMLCARLYEPKRIIAIDCMKERLAFAEKYKMADLTFTPDDMDLLEREIRALTDGRGADAVVEAAGGTNTFEMAWRLARPNAVIGLEAMYEEPQTLPLPDMYGKNLIWKSGGVDACKCKEILELIREGRLDARPLITHTCTLSEIEKAYRIFENHEDGVMKYAVYPE